MEDTGEEVRYRPGLTDLTLSLGSASLSAILRNPQKYLFPLSATAVNNRTAELNCHTEDRNHVGN